MKKEIKLLKNAALVLLAISFPLALNAQEAEVAGKSDTMQDQKLERMEKSIPDLTKDQKASIKEIRIASMNETKPIRNEIAEKQAKLKTLKSQENPDMNSINVLIDEISVLKADVAKKEAKAQQDIRVLLNDEQKIAFDSKMDKRKDRVRHSSQK